MIDGSDVRMTLNYIIDSSREKYGDLPAIGMALKEPVTYEAFHERICALALRMQKEGIKKGDRIAILAENSDCWGTAYLAAVRNGAVSVPILPDLPAADVHHILSEMKVSFVFTTQRQIEKVYEFSGGSFQKVVTLDDYEKEEGFLPTAKFSEYLEEALAEYREKKVLAEDIVFPEVDENDIASILYTSGTSGFSRAVMLTHKNLTSNAFAAAGLHDVKPGSVFLSILPMSHTYEFTTGFMLPLLLGARIAYAGKTPTPAILQNLCAHEKPALIFAVPLVLEKIYKKRVLPKIEKSSVMKIICKAKIGRRLIYRRIGAKLMEFFGGRLELMGVGGASLNPDVEKFLKEAEFPYLIGYGMTEAAPLISGGPFGDKTITVGSAGKPLPGVEVKLEDVDPESRIGEIYVRGPNVMNGYYNDPEGTAEAVSPDGWLSTGDLGLLDDQGNLHIKGRSKNVIVMANGENVYPEVIEHLINAYHWVGESLIVENNGQLNAWIYPDYESIDDATEGKSRQERRDYLGNLLEELRKEVNLSLPKASRISEVFERREPFIKTATHKIKRYLYNGHAKIA
ncbi:MAG: long-chain fatty acid--CoA ligase [Desulfobacterales bacterium]|nr:MAG: long-chain fatty acid--CoA ligase [Desulfobacterales bacterium]